MGITALNGEITRQAAMVAYIDDFKVMMFITLAVAPLLLFMRISKTPSAPPLHAVVD
jgi:DHA2 family multidrug resistance protein